MHEGTPEHSVSPKHKATPEGKDTPDRKATSERKDSPDHKSPLERAKTFEREKSSERAKAIEDEAMTSPEREQTPENEKTPGRNKSLSPPTPLAREATPRQDPSPEHEESPLPERQPALTPPPAVSYGWDEPSPPSQHGGSSRSPIRTHSRSRSPTAPPAHSRSRSPTHSRSPASHARARTRSYSRSLSPAPPTAEEQEQIATLTTNFKKKGHFDELRKRVYQRFTEEGEDRFIEALRAIVDAEVDRDPSLSVRDRSSAADIIGRVVEREGAYAAVDAIIDRMLEEEDLSGEIERINRNEAVRLGYIDPTPPSPKEHANNAQAEDAVDGEDSAMQDSLPANSVVGKDAAATAAIDNDKSMEDASAADATLVEVNGVDKSIN